MYYLELSPDNDIPHNHMIHILYPYPLNIVSLHYIFRSVSELSMFYIRTLCFNTQKHTSHMRCYTFSNSCYSTVGLCFYAFFSHNWAEAQLNSPVRSLSVVSASALSKLQDKITSGYTDDCNNETQCPWEFHQFSKHLYYYHFLLIPFAPPAIFPCK